MGLQKGQMTDMQEWYHDRSKRRGKKASRSKVAPKDVIESAVERIVQKRVREKVQGVLEDVKKLWIKALSDPNLFGEAKKRKKR